LIFVPTSITQTTWQWQNRQNFSYLTCSLLERWAHGFFTRDFYPAGPSDLVRHLDPNASVSQLKQIHGNLVWTPKEIEQPLKQGDGLLSDGPKQSLWVASADCTPALVGDVNTGRVAALHAGWRGTSKKILPVAISRLLADGSRLQDLRVALGPAISGEVYQVALEVAQEVVASLVSSGNPEKLTPSPILSDLEVGKVRLDVRHVNFHQMLDMGLLPEQITLAPYCTYQDESSFFSYRRTGQKQVQWSGIVSL
jgi:polyphenol oxidase